MATNKYTLHFYAAGSNTESFSCSTDSTSDIINSEKTVLCKGQITKLSYDKSMYNQCRIDATIALSSYATSTTTQGVKKALFGMVCKMTTDCSNNATIAESYVVYNVTPHTSNTNDSINQQQDKLVLLIYSMDKLLNIVEECQSFVGKHLVKDIVDEAIKRYTNGLDYKLTLNTKAKEKTDDPEPTVVDNLQFLKYKIDNKNYEFIQPYLVQYNETFYSMLIRTANRCGEYVFFEDGKLHIGLTYDDATTCDTPTLDSVELPAKSLATTKELTNISHYSRMYHSNTSEKQAIKKTLDISGLGSVSIGETTSNEFIQDYGISVDDNLFEYKSGEYTTFGDTYTAADGMSLFYMVLNDDHPFLSMLARLGVYLAFQLGDIGNKKDRANANMNTNMSGINPNGEESEYLKDSKKRLFGSHDSSDANFNNLAHKGLAFVRRLEQVLGDTKIIFNLDTANNNTVAKLGQKIEFENKYYIVTRTTGFYEDNRFSESVEAVPVITIDSTNYLIPPMIPAGHIRYAQPQLAKVSDTADPLDLGRVRVNYYWQDENSSATPFIRMQMPYAAPNKSGLKYTAGAYFQPCKDNEVMVAYDHGDVECPYVVSALYNKAIPPQIGPNNQSPNTRVIRSTNGHRLVFTDLKNEDFLAGFIGGSWPLKTICEGVGNFNQDYPNVGGGFCLTDSKGLYCIEGSSDRRQISISSPVGTVKFSAFEGINIVAPHGDITIYGKNVDIKARNKVTMQSGLALSQQLWSLGSEASWAEAGMELIKTYVIDLSIIRTILERVLEPVNGSIDISAATGITTTKHSIKQTTWKKWAMNTFGSWIYTFSDWPWTKDHNHRLKVARDIISGKANGATLTEGKEGSFNKVVKDNNVIGWKYVKKEIILSFENENLDIVSENEEVGTENEEVGTENEE